MAGAAGVEGEGEGEVGVDVDAVLPLLPHAADAAASIAATTAILAARTNLGVLDRVSGMICSPAK